LEEITEVPVKTDTKTLTDRQIGSAGIIAFFVGSIVCLLLLSLLTAAIMLGHFLYSQQAGDFAASANSVEESLIFAGSFSILQNTGLAALVAIILIALSTDGKTRWFKLPPRTEWMGRWKSGFALYRVPKSQLIIVSLGALTVGIFPQWIASTLLELFPHWSLGNLDKVLEGLMLGTPTEKGILILAIIGAAPICEELIFRGFLWKMTSYLLAPLGVVLVTTGLFAIYHVDPIHLISTIPIGLYLAWVRLRTGSLIPCIAVHFINNALAISTIFFLPVSDVGPSLTVCLVSLTWSLLACVALYYTTQNTVIQS
jgi:membrane protease YdiL (CAAX protease family)